MPSESVLLLCVVVALGAVAYSYIIYPLAIALMAAAVGRTPEGPPSCEPAKPLAQTSDDHLPTVTLLIAAHNEEQVIGKRIENALNGDYPGHLLEILITSDGSTDATEEIVRSFSDPRVKLLAHTPNRGKSYSLNRAVPQAQGTVIVMSDANTDFKADAVRRLVARLTGRDQPLAVCGKLILVDPISGDNVDGLYWRYESWQKRCEGRLAATLGANGGIYAFRRDDYCPIPDNTIVDDMTIPLLMKLRRGGNIVFAPDAVAEEEAAPSIADEFGRRIRIGIGAFQSLPLLWPLLLPRYGFTALAFFSHKVLRWFSPHLLIVAFVATLLGLNHQSLQWVAMGWLAAGATVALGSRVSGNSPISRILRLAHMFASMNAALLLGFLRWLGETQTGTWKRTAREN